MKRNQIRLLVLVLAVLSTSACTTLSFVKPEVNLVNLRFTDLTLFETSGVFTIRLSNENPEPVQLEGGVYNLYLDGLKVGKGLSDRHLEIPPLSSITDEVELHLSNLAVATRFRSILESQEIDYRIKAKIYVRRSYGRQTVTLSRDGRYDFKPDAVEKPSLNP